MFLAYASPMAQAFVDMQLYLPRTWAEDVVRRHKAGVPDTVPYHSKADLALALRRSARTRRQLTSPWVTGAGDCGQDAAFREALDAEG
jgi:SRSO17 transposase